VFAVGVHLLLEDCPLACGPTAVLPGSHRSGQAPPFDRMRDPRLTFEGREAVLLTGRAGDLAFFVSDVWHRRMPTTDEDRGRFFLQIHYGRRDLAQRLRPTASCHQLSEAAFARATTPRDRTVVGLHPPLFYDG
jgi:ectoine hydroxylase-related dioxygenase (phytanoyl-CoA dioxygenase family)